MNRRKRHLLYRFGRGADAAQYADVNGDGKADLIYQGSDNSFWVSLSTGKSFTSPAWWMQHGGSFVAAKRSMAMSMATAKPISFFAASTTVFG